MYKTNVKKITEFWNNHFVFKKTIVTTAKYKALNFFCEIHGNIINHHEFSAISGTIGVKTKITRKSRLYLAMPTSVEARRYLNNSGTESVEEEIVEDGKPQTLKIDGKQQETPLIDGKQQETPLIDGKQLETPQIDGKQLETTGDFNVINTSEGREKGIECMEDDEDVDENLDSEENLEEFIVLDEYRMIEVHASQQNNSILAGERKKSGKRKSSAENLQEFCETHYSVKKAKGTIPMQEVYKFYQATTTQKLDGFQTFKIIERL